METATTKKFLFQRNGYKLKSNSNRWYVEYYKEIFPGYRKRIKVYGGINRHTNHHRRYKAAKDLIDELCRGTWYPNFEPVHISSTIDKLYNDRSKYLRKKSRDTYWSKLTAFIDFCRARRVDDWKKVTDKFAVAFLASINPSPTTINAYRDTLRGFCKDAVKAGYLKANPFEGIRKLPEDDRQPHLTSQQAYTLLHGIIKEYTSIHHTNPARLVLHKTSNYNEDELDGFKKAAQELRVSYVDYITILDSSMRLFRSGLYPIQRETHVKIDSSTHILFTKGSIDFTKRVTISLEQLRILIRIKAFRFAISRTCPT